MVDKVLGCPPTAYVTGFRVAILSGHLFAWEMCEKIKHDKSAV
jgi:hypothetical protein